MMKVRANESAITEFLHIALMSPACRNYFRSKATGAAGNMPKINQGIVMNTPIPKCSRDEQRAVVDAMSKHHAIARSLELAIERAKVGLEKARASILSIAFNGQLVDQIPNEGTGHELLVQLNSSPEVEAPAGVGKRKAKAVHDQQRTT
jgi:type I restriction enzyme S subunit